MFFFKAELAKHLGTTHKKLKEITTIHSKVFAFKMEKNMNQNVVHTVQCRTECYRCTVACAKTNKSWNFASIFGGLLEVGMESPKNDFQIYRPINDPRRAVSSLGGDIVGYP